MKPMRVVIGLSIVLAALLFFHEVGHGKVAKLTKRMTVDATSSGTNTHIVLKKGQKVTISAFGKITFAWALTKEKVGPAGLSRKRYKNDPLFVECYHACRDPMENEPHAGLMATIEKSKFFVGGKKTFEVGSPGFPEGRLMLRINDCTLSPPPHACGNAGRFIVDIEVE